MYGVSTPSIASMRVERLMPKKIARNERLRNASRVSVNTRPSVNDDVFRPLDARCGISRHVPAAQTNTADATAIPKQIENST